MPPEEIAESVRVILVQLRQLNADLYDLQDICTHPSTQIQLVIYGPDRRYCTVCHKQILVDWEYSDE